MAIKPHASFARVWTSEATGSRRAASFWHAKFEQSFAARNRDRVPLGSYATPGLSDPSRYAPVNASTGALGPAGKHANALEVTDTKAWAMAGSPHLQKVVDALFPHPTRFRQVWGQEWKHVSAFAWAAVPPPARQPNHYARTKLAAEALVQERRVVMRDRRAPLQLRATDSQSSGRVKRHHTRWNPRPGERSGHLPRPTQNPLAVEILFLVEERGPSGPPGSNLLPGSRDRGSACSHVSEIKNVLSQNGYG